MGLISAWYVLGLGLDLDLGRPGRLLEDGDADLMRSSASLAYYLATETVEGREGQEGPENWATNWGSKAKDGNEWRGKRTPGPDPGPDRRAEH